MGAVSVEVVPYASDNYSYLILSDDAVALVDCGEAAPVLDRLKSLNRTLDAVLICHTHYDHVAGLTKIMLAFPEARVYSPSTEISTGGKPVNRVTDGMEIDIGSGAGSITVTVLSLPAHTRHCVNYYTGGNLFTSDTLFSAGCGRLFEGTPAELESALDRIAAYPPETRLYFGHEYTRSNLEFARSVEPNNPDIAKYLEEVDSLRAAGGFTTPSTVGRERLVNPFLRLDREAVIEFVDPEVRYSRTERMGLLRREKDKF